MTVYVVFSRSWFTTAGDFNEYYKDVAFSEAEVVKMTGYLFREMTVTNNGYKNNEWRVIERKPFGVE